MLTCILMLKCEPALRVFGREPNTPGQFFWEYPFYFPWELPKSPRKESLEQNNLLENIAEPQDVIIVELLYYSSMKIGLYSCIYLLGKSKLSDVLTDILHEVRPCCLVCRKCTSKQLFFNKYLERKYF